MPASVQDGPGWRPIQESPPTDLRPAPAPAPAPAPQPPQGSIPAPLPSGWRHILELPPPDLRPNRWRAPRPREPSTRRPDRWETGVRGRLRRIAIPPSTCAPSSARALGADSAGSRCPHEFGRRHRELAPKELPSGSARERDRASVTLQPKSTRRGQ